MTWTRDATFHDRLKYGNPHSYIKRVLRPTCTSKLYEHHIMESMMIEEEKLLGGLDKNSTVVVVVGGGGEKKEESEEGEVALPGFRFHPTDEELVGFYLRRKVDKKPLSVEIIKQIDIYKYDPWDLPKVSTVGDKEWYFFCLRGRKYRNSIRPNRVTGSGFWKATGIDRPINLAGDHKECIGLKKSLVYYRGSAGKGTKTDWMMHEFRLPSNNKNDPSSPSTQEAEIWTICRILKRNVTYKKYAQVCKQITADHSSSKPSNSFESESGLTLATNYTEGTNQLFTGQQWTPISQSPLTSFNSQVPNPSTDEFYREANWDELGRIVEYVIDPALIYECT